MTGPLVGQPAGRSFADLHCHTNASFDCLTDPLAAVRAAARRGITHLAITDHDRIDAALRARDAAVPGITVIVGSEVRTREGDLICLFLERPIAPGLPALEAIAAAREQGGLVGIPHPFDRFRGSMLKDRGSGDPHGVDDLAGRVDWIESWNARVVGHAGNERAADLARSHGLPGIAVSDAHSLHEVGIAYTVLDGDPSTPAGLRSALATAAIVPGRASYLARTITPVAKVIQRLRGNVRIRPAAAGESVPRDPGAAEPGR